MTVSAILDAKGREVYAEKSTSTIGEICAVLSGRGIGAVLLSDAPDKISGIVSERDVVRAIAMHGSEAMGLPAADFMTKAVKVCDESETLLVVLARMTEGRFRHMPVVDDGRVIGLISIGDVVKHRIAQVEREAEEMRSYIHTS
ncbi:CBS domain-containing protein [Polycladidibacter stylochi]|uniref:CBS domain-containing protein n=1 Tax=Polycladidibacter stylochi TaxID=1807766 RepID=UPI00082FBC8B|nr:CBS domain-containing protein [Pseudovibrio stylochi]